MIQKSKQGNWWLVGGVILLVILPLIFIKGEYSGSDGQAEEAITKIKPDYEPWFESILKPPSSEIENLLFVSQGAIASGILGYIIGLYKGRSER
jgi:cobalt/nickel transport protein